MPVSYTCHDHVLVIRLDRPEKCNAIDAEMTDGLDEALNGLEDDVDLWVGVVIGTGDVFSAGTDLVKGAGGRTPRGGEYGIVRRPRSKPVIAAVNGLAYGGGFELALACDLIVAARTATFALPEVFRGAIASSGGLFRAPRALPINVARELLLTGEPLTAERAWSLGLVNAVVDPHLTLDVAMDLAASICAKSPTSVRATLRALNQIAADSDEQGWKATKHAVESVADSADLHEGLTAFREKRGAEFHGH
jgi:enoyl-CoA hydratase